MLVEQIIEFEWREPGPPGRTCTPITAHFNDKTKISKKNLRVNYWNDRRSRRVFLCFYSAIFQLTSAKFQTFAYNSRTVGPSYMKF